DGYSSAIFAGTVAGMYAQDVAGNATFAGAVGQSDPLASLNVTGTSSVFASVVNTPGDQTYQGAVQLLNDATRNSSDGSIAFGAAVDGAHHLTATAAGDITFAGPVGSNTALTGLDAVYGGLLAFTGASPSVHAGGDV